ncbi:MULTISPECIES: Pr6Pr family membrane protein [unclassified Streptomyces]|uniref:Pr6Pr family membrane protein n=1 Tax=unclassified Streptomyces TaxID=2593676 RepID=UPI000C271B68|nr:Pr6Pr family membrane protein [Streptomyces sp. CB01373]PJM95670.1 integral membrane regulator [Streptomyces sp. CB01373]
MAAETPELPEVPEIPPTPFIPRDIPELPVIPGIVKLMPSSFVPPAAVMGPTRHLGAAVCRLLTAAAIVAAVAVELHLGSPARVLSAFAIQSSILLALVLCLSARRAWTARRPLPAWLTGATVLYSVITAVVHHALLTRTSPAFSITGEPGIHPLWQRTATVILLTAAPIAALLDWLLLTEPDRLHLNQAAPWLLFPLAYLAFSLTRGELLPADAPDRYLHPFLDVSQHGYKHVLATALLLGLAFYALALLLVAVDHTRPNPIRRRAKTGFRLWPPVG